MDVYLVGGAVRDDLLGREVRERDWVVVGSTPEAMRRLGYKQVGRDFPVFLHPDTGEEYALARTERKTGPGHTGFVCHAGPDVTLEEDLERRDLTINAMARSAAGELIDPFGGRRDLERRTLRHVSDAFVEDPLRVFRVARFAAQLPGFEVAAETLALMRSMAADGALSELSAERVWQELYKALAAPAPQRFLDVLAAAGALAPWFTELEGVTADWPAEPDPGLRFGAVAWQLDAERVRSLCERLKAPKRFRQLGEHVAGHGRVLAAWRGEDPAAVLAAMEAIGALDGQRDPEPALTVIERQSGRDLTDLRELAARLRAIGSDAFRAEGKTGKALGQAIRDARLERIRAEAG
ncbi:MAG TPA: multifunctional CCA tRNA nucleotidyl transferase/2'3'-cyclic phosphodiesterase/2'nucleotidase/phosphatase [Pseudomonadales bacterium]